MRDSIVEEPIEEAVKAATYLLGRNWQQKPVEDLRKIQDKALGDLPGYVEAYELAVRHRPDYAPAGRETREESGRRIEIEQTYRLGRAASFALNNRPDGKAYARSLKKNLGEQIKKAGL